MHFRAQSARLIETQWVKDPIGIQYTLEETKQFLESFKVLHVEFWKNEYTESNINNETYWELAVKLEGSRGSVWRGSSSYPYN